MVPDHPQESIHLSTISEDVAESFDIRRGALLLDTWQKALLGTSVLVLLHALGRTGHKVQDHGSKDACKERLSIQVALQRDKAPIFECEL